MTDFVGLPSLPPVVARRVAVALDTSRASLATCREVLESMDGECFAQMAQVLAGMEDYNSRVRAMLGTGVTKATSERVRRG